VANSGARNGIRKSSNLKKPKRDFSFAYHFDAYFHIRLYEVGKFQSKTIE
jgi:hypothetical protein